MWQLLAAAPLAKHEAWHDVQAAGRTDAGVHASGQAVQFFLDQQLPQANVAAMHTELNPLLPDDVRALRVVRTPPDLHVRLSPLWREYHYVMAWGDVEDPLQRRFAGFHFGDLDAVAMERAVAQFVGRHNFQAFATGRMEAADAIRVVLAARMVCLSQKRVRFEVRATQSLLAVLWFSIHIAFVQP